MGGGRYLLVCTALGLVLGWIPMFLHGPIAEKFDRLFVTGAIAVWGWYTARLSIGFWVGVSRWPRQWWLRGPLVGALALFPLTLVSLATPGCGAPCMFWNLVTAAALGSVVGYLAFRLTGRHHA